jgi:hypothetical protein
MTQNNLGNALWTLGARESGTAQLEQAVAAYRAALLGEVRQGDEPVLGLLRELEHGGMST